MLSIILGLYLLLLVILNFQPTQQWLTHEIENTLSERLCTDVHIGEVDVDLFNRVVLKDVILYDQQQDSLLQADLMSAKIELSPLFHGEISLRTVSLLDGQIKLYKEAENDNANFQFLIDAFKTKEQKEKKQLNLKINSIILRRCQLAYDVRDVAETPLLINPSHIAVSQLDANVSMKKLTADSLNVRVRSLQFKEKSGLDVRALTFRLAANRHRCEISHFLLDLPNSRIAQQNMVAEYQWKEARDFWPTLTLKGALEQADVATDDIAFCVPQLKELKQKVKLSADFHIDPTTIVLNKLRLDEQRKRVQLKAQAVLSRENGVITEAKATVNRVFVDSAALIKLFSGFSGKPAPMELKRLGNVVIDGRLHYLKDQPSEVKGNVTTKVGGMNAFFLWKGHTLTGDVAMNLSRLKTVHGRPGLPDKLVAHARASVDLTDKQRPQVEGQLLLREVDFYGHDYQDINLSAQLLQQKLSATLTSLNPHAHMNLDFRANLKGKLLSAMELNGDVKDFNPGKLNLSQFMREQSIAARISAKLENLDFKHPQADLSVENFTLSGETPYQLSSLRLTTKNSKLGTLATLNSDFGKVRFNGPLSLQHFKLMMGNMLGYRLPGFVNIDEEGNRHKWEFKVKLSKSDFFTQVLQLPIAFDNGINAEGYLSSNGDRIFLSAVADHLKFNKTEISQLRVLLRDRDKELLSRIQLDKRVGKRDVHFELENSTQQGALHTDLVWGDLSEGKYTGVFQAQTSIDGNNNFTTRILPTRVNVNDSVWNIQPGEIRMMKDSISIKKLSIQHSDQSLKVYGKLSKNPKDSLFADLHKMDVEYIMTIAKLRNFTFSGKADGQVALANTFDSLRVKAHLDVPRFYFNDGYMGHAKIEGDFAMKDKRLHLFGDIQEKGVGFTQVRGFVGIGERQLDLEIASKNTNIYFLNRYVKGIFSDMEGRTTGTCRVYGDFGKIDFGGEEITDAHATVDATGVRYAMTGGKVLMSPGKFGFENFGIDDGIAGSGTLNGHLLHHYLKNLRYHMEVTTSNLKVYDKDESLDMPFYATTYGTGRVEINGKPGLMEADIAMRPERKTEFVYTVDSPESFGDVQLLKFADAQDTLKIEEEVNTEQKEVKKAPAPSMDIRLNFLVDMNPEALLKVVMDRKAGDHLLVHGDGPIRASFYNKGSFEMFGKLNVDRGVYKMSIQDVIRKDFEFTKGSFINFSGDPFMGDLGLRAIYTVNSASLADLNIGSNLSDNSVKVNCVLNFSGKVKSPQVSFDLELPSVSEDVQQMVRNLISSEEDMNMQILYLLGVGRFYTYNYSSTAAGENQSQSAVAVKSFLSNTLSSQLNNIISNAVGSSNWSFGANLSTGSMGWSDMEVEGILSGRLLNNRLLINGNFGYRDRPTYSSTTNFVGDFDVRYLLTPGGGVSLKAYSETNDRYFSKSSLTTQGIGLLLKRDFTNLRDLFRRKDKKKVAKEKKTKMEKKEENHEVPLVVKFGEQ